MELTKSNVYTIQGSCDKPGSLQNACLTSKARSLSSKVRFTDYHQGFHAGMTCFNEELEPGLMTLNEDL